MLALIIIANPNSDSFSHAMATTAERVLGEANYEISSHDLYAEGFDPVQPYGETDNIRSDDELVEIHCSALSRADMLLIFHPNWWGQPPAILKGWIDRVVRLGTAYHYPTGTGLEGVPVGLLTAKCAFVFNTSNTPQEREEAEFGDPLDTIWRKCVFKLCGIDNVVRRMYGPTAGSSPEKRKKWLVEVATLVNNAV